MSIEGNYLRLLGLFVVNRDSGLMIESRMQDR
jgi:hypothetical protein